MTKVTINQGTLIGGKSKTANGFEYVEFMQIPYAKPPIKDLRFKSPQPAQPWVGERDATSIDRNNISLQYDQFKKEIVGSEDCLYLNVYTPNLLSDDIKPLPVMVYIHGGGFVYGNGIIKEKSGPDFLIEHGVVLVTINYRLGVFGFLSLDIPEAAGNMGLKDQIMALKWIQTNIEKFGGNKDNVTVFGISAGSASIEYLMLTRMNKGLFHKAILQSGSALNHWAINYNIKDLSVKLAQELGYQGSSNDDRGIYEHLIEQPSDVLGEVAVKVISMYSVKGFYLGFVPSIEKDFGNSEQFLTDYPYNLLKEGRFNKVPILRGFCDSEGYLCAFFKPQDFNEFLEQKQKKFMDFWKYTLNSNDENEYNERFGKLYDAFGNDSSSERYAVDFFGDYDFTSGIITSSKLMASNGIRIYAYMFKYDGNMNFFKKTFNFNKKGACHGDDSAYTMNMFMPSEANPTDTDMLIINRISTMWTDFAKTCNPTPRTTDVIPVPWPAYDIKEEKYYVIDKELKVTSSFEPKKIAVFEEIYEKYQK